MAGKWRLGGNVINQALMDLPFGRFVTNAKEFEVARILHDLAELKVAIASIRDHHLHRPDARDTPEMAKELLTPINPTTHPSIDEVLTEFLEEQRIRLSTRTFSRYEDVIELLRGSLNGYAYSSLCDEELQQWEQAFRSGDEDAYCRLFGPEKIQEHYGEFLGYYMVRKVFCGSEFLKAAGTVTRKLAQWLGERGYSDELSTQDAIERAQEAGRELPAANRLGRLLYDVAESGPCLKSDSVDDGDRVEDYLAITKVEPGRIWFEGDIEIAVPSKASDLAQPGWSAFITAQRSRGSWHLLEVGCVYP